METAESASAMTGVSDEASNVMPLSSDLQQASHKEVSSVEKEETPASEDGSDNQAAEEDGEGSDGSEEGGATLITEENGSSTLEHAEKLIEKGTGFKHNGDYASATDCLSRALEIQVEHYGELAPECVRAYYEYGCALLYKAQQETDPLSIIPTKESNVIKNGEHSESSVAPAITDGQEENTSIKSGEITEASSAPSVIDEEKVCTPYHPTDGKHLEDDRHTVEVDGCMGSEDDLEDADEDESDLDLSWKSLDIARAITEKQSDNSIIAVDILSALGEVALEREDIETSLNDYKRALSILQKLVEPDNRRIAELNFRICLVLEIAFRVKEALPYCREAISICRLRLERLQVESGSAAVQTCSTSSTSDINQTEALSQDEATTTSSRLEEIKTLSGLLIDLEKKLEDLEQAALNPSATLSEMLKMVESKPNGNLGDTFKTVPPMTSSEIGCAASVNTGFESPSVSTGAARSGGSVTDLGVVGRGVKRVNGSNALPPSKKPSLN